MNFTYHDLQKCAAREVALRARVYAKAGMTPARERELEMMRAIARILTTWANFYGDRDALSDAVPQSLDSGDDVIGRSDDPLVADQKPNLDPVLGKVMGDENHADMGDRHPDGVQNLPQHATPPLADGKGGLIADGAVAVNATDAAYRDSSYPLRKCDYCGREYRGPAVYCSHACAIEDA